MLRLLALILTWFFRLMRTAGRMPLDQQVGSA